MFVVLDNNKVTHAKTRVLHHKLLNISVEFIIVTAFILGHKRHFLLYIIMIIMDDPCVLSQASDELNAQAVKESQILLGCIPVIESEV